MFSLCRCALLVLLAVASVNHMMSQDRGEFRPDRNAFYDSLKAESARLAELPKETTKVFKMDFSTVEAPASIEDFSTFWHTPPLSQGISGMCWCFSTTSFFESEIHRLHGRSIKLSEPFTVYWEYVEKARRFVRQRGDSYIGEGSEANAVPRIWKTYGIVPLEAYPGKPDGRRFYDHAAMFAELKKYLTSVSEAGAWNEEVVLGTVRAILDHYMGPPPATITVGKRSMSPQKFFKEIVALDMDDYVDIISLMEQPSWAFVEYAVQDNWWKSKEYINVPLDVFMDVVREAVRRGYSMVLGGDTSEPGYDGNVGIAVVPSFDIRPEEIDENARQLRFSNKTTTDDHGVHLVGHTLKDGQHWYLIKDSGSGSRNNTHPGYFFYREDYIKLKMVDLMIHRDVVPEILARVRH
jgi:bleomycin hydrolase